MPRCDVHAVVQPKIRMHERSISIGLVSFAALVAAVATACFVMQDGLGGGHGELDRVLFALALPWSLIPWPELFASIDFVWLVLLPFILNVATIVVGACVIQKLKRREQRAVNSASAH